MISTISACSPTKESMNGSTLRIDHMAYSELDHRKPPVTPAVPVLTCAFNAKYIKYYRKLYPFRRPIIFGGAFGIVVAIGLFLVTLILLVLSESPFVAILGLVGVVIMALSCFACQCGYVATKFHEAQENDRAIYTTTNNSLGGQCPTGMPECHGGADPHTTCSKLEAGEHRQVDRSKSTFSPQDIPPPI